MVEASICKTHLEASFADEVSLRARGPKIAHDIEVAES